MPTDLPPAVERVVTAVNEADTEAFVAAFTADGRVDDWGRVLEGPEGIRSWADTDAIGQQARMEVTSASTDGDVTELQFTWTSNRFTGDSSAFVTVRDDLVAEFRIPPG